MRNLEAVARDRQTEALGGQPALFDKLRELTRSGYVPDTDADPDSGGILLRHDSAPDLVLNADGSIDLPTGQTTRRQPAAIARDKEKRIYWRRTFLVVVITIGVWFMSLAVAAAIIGEIAD